MATFSSPSALRDAVAKDGEGRLQGIGVFRVVVDGRKIKLQYNSGMDDHGWVWFSAPGTREHRTAAYDLGFGTVLMALENIEKTCTRIQLPTAEELECSFYNGDLRQKLEFGKRDEALAFARAEIGRLEKLVGLLEAK